jgi:uncharacterized alpha-E superfamily protein
VLSRVADAIYWMNRYIERAENVARFVDVSLHLSLDDLGGSDSQWAALVATTGDDAYFRSRFGEPDRKKVMEFLTFDKEYPSSILSCFEQARENARSIRDVISSEMWEQINTAYHMVKGAAGSQADAPGDFFSAVKKAAHLFVGITYLTMTHNEAWHFGRVGRLIERGDKTSRILDVKYFILLPSINDVGGAYDEAQWTALLKSASAFEMYRKRHGDIRPANVVDFLMLERKFPRSILYCLIKAERSLRAITGTPEGTSLAERSLGSLRAQFEYAVTKEIIEKGLHEYLDDFQVKLNRVGEAIFETFFAITPFDPPASMPPPQ